MIDTQHELPLAITGDWQVAVGPGRIRQGDATHTITGPVTLAVPPAVRCTVHAERDETLPLFNADAPGWMKGAHLRGVETQETTAKGALAPESLVLTSPDGEITYRPDVDYALDSEWGTIGRLPDGRIDAAVPVAASYRHGQGRLDAIVLDRSGHLRLCPGTPHISVPMPPPLAVGEVAVAHLWVPARLPYLSADCLFPITETAYPEPPATAPSIMEQRCPRTLAKLRRGERLRILAWGDSVTDGGYLPVPGTLGSALGSPVAPGYPLHHAAAQCHQSPGCARHAALHRQPARALPARLKAM